MAIWGRRLPPEQRRAHEFATEAGSQLYPLADRFVVAQIDDTPGLYPSLLGAYFAMHHRGVRAMSVDLDANPVEGYSPARAADHFVVFVGEANSKDAKAMAAETLRRGGWSTIRGAAYAWPSPKTEVHQYAPAEIFDAHKFTGGERPPSIEELVKLDRFVQHLRYTLPGSARSTGVYLRADADDPRTRFVTRALRERGIGIRSNGLFSAPPRTGEIVVVNLFDDPERFGHQDGVRIESFQAFIAGKPEGPQ